MTGKKNCVECILESIYSPCGGTSCYLYKNNKLCFSISHADTSDYSSNVLLVVYSNPGDTILLHRPVNQSYKKS